jgi:hypothetical protein
MINATKITFLFSIKRLMQFFLIISKMEQLTKDLISVTVMNVRQSIDKWKKKFIVQTKQKSTRSRRRRGAVDPTKLEGSPGFFFSFLVFFFGFFFGFFFFFFFALSRTPEWALPMELVSHFFYLINTCTV